MRHRVKITVLDTTLNEELQRRYLANPESGVCPCFKKGDSFDFWREEDRDDFYKFGVENPFRAPKRGTASADTCTRDCRAERSCTSGPTTTAS